MKKLITLIILTFIFYNSGQSARIISIFEIARWYLDADLVLIYNVSHTDTLLVAEYDSLLTDGFHLRYDIFREKYHPSALLQVTFLSAARLNGWECFPKTSGAKCTSRYAFPAKDKKTTSPPQNSAPKHHMYSNSFLPCLLIKAEPNESENEKRTIKIHPITCRSKIKGANFK